MEAVAVADKKTDNRNAGTCQCNKRKSTHLTAQEKLNIIKQVESRSIPSVALEYQVDQSTLRRWLKNRTEIEKCCGKGPKKKQIRSTPNEEVNQALKVWFDEMRNRGFPVSGPILKAKAIEFHGQMGGTDKFYASDGWLSSWKSSFQIRQLSVVREKLFADTTSAEKFRSNFLEMFDVEKLTAKQIFYADQTGLNYKMMANNTLAIKTEENATGFKQNEERITVMPCSNADGSCKLPLLVIGKSAKPRALKNISKDNLPVYYTHQASAWMSHAIFEVWFKEEFVSRVSIFLQEQDLPRKAVLILHNAPSHLTPEMLNVDGFTVLFLPPNMTSLIQPMDQRIIATMKKKYRCLLLSSILNGQENNFSLIAHLKSINIKDVIFWVSEAWDEVSPGTISKCWKALLPEKSSTTSAESSEEVSTESVLRILRRVTDYELATTETTENWLTNSDDLPLVEPSIEEIISIIRDRNNNSDIDDDSVVSEGDLPLEDASVTAKDAELGANWLIKFFEQNGIISKSDMAVLRRLRNKVIAKKLHI